MKSKVVFIDVDGTLCLDDGHTVPESAQAACKQARKNGHKLFLCTGRSKPEIFDNILEVGFDGIIGAGGGFADVNQENLFHKQMQEADVKAVQAYFEEHGILYYIESNEGLFGSRELQLHLAKLMSPDDIEKGLEAPFVKALQPFSDDIDYASINKICFLDNANHPLQDVEEKFKDVFEVLACTVPAFGKNSGELIIKGVSKSVAIDQVLAHIGVSKNETIAIGDGKNDIDMFEYCNVGVAVGNADPKLKEVSDFVVRRHDDGGLADAFSQLQLI
ncbi:Cof subfamily protein (haloacid dehalogenase superfamily)/HAD superfamily hydrolase (TIGR01484 family) [Breznakia blatticola]|uniref:Cof subfamily protein (Haloacid dehalogenase superfamily)/HAD superfamily hydrolase (TIGR01484 family) n=1 Tax=Breznakia blatticola TaxID=1754012 RepID=A0A4R7ZCC4_9FIRM|nr:Cof-type HAD-IIB family hydrolase [Breznakia blatticola]TDW14635.1 Cof subfamily protein (haloacid dehalogenase superfamily)/HAD superfamily hydrolase (TIGR01484 family) [Breznakia blatticola]